MKPADLIEFLKIDLPHSVPPEEKRILKTETKRIPIVTDSISVEDGYYFVEPTLNDLMTLREMIYKINPDASLDEVYNVMMQYVIERMCNISITEETKASLIDEVETFITQRLRSGFLYLEILSAVRSSTQNSGTTGITEESEL